MDNRSIDHGVNLEGESSTSAQKMSIFHPVHVKIWVMSRVKAHLSNKTANQPSFSDFMHLQTILLTNHRKGWHSDHTLSSLTETWKSNKNKKSKDKPFSILLRGREEGPLKCSRVVRVYSSLQVSSSQGYAQHFVAGTHTQSNLYLKVTLNPLSPESDQHQISPCNSNAL